MTGLGKPVSNLDASEKEPGIELKPAGKAATQSGMTEIQQDKAEKGKNLQNHRVLQTKLTAKMPDGTALLLLKYLMCCVIQGQKQMWWIWKLPGNCIGMGLHYSLLEEH